MVSGSEPVTFFRGLTISDQKEHGTEAMHWNLPLLPLVVERVPEGLILALRQEGIPLVDAAAAARTSGAAPLGRFLLYDSRRDGTAPAQRAKARHQCPVDVHALRQGWPFDPFEALVSTESRRIEWEIEGHRLSEEIGYYPKAEVRGALCATLRELLDEQGGIWLRCSPFPYPYRSAFNVRIDHDQYEPSALDTVLRRLEGHEDSTSHFICGSAFERHRQVLGRFAGLDVGSHGWWHHTYRNEEQNRKNVQRGIEALGSAGLEPVGFVAPHGRWNAGLDRVLNELGVEYSSEFGLAYDDLPFAPHLKARREESGGTEPFSSVLQVPVHPVCLGLFLDAGVRDDALVQRYFEQVIHSKYARAEPVFLYGHPTHRLGSYPDVLDAILSAAEGCGLLWPTTLCRFARWWCYRNNLRLTVFRIGDGLEVHVAGASGPLRAGIELWRGNHVAALPLEKDTLRIRPDELAYALRPKTAPVLEPVSTVTSGGFRQQLRQWLDWEHVTPTEEIRINTLPGMLKRGLRRMRRTPDQ